MCEHECEFPHAVGGEGARVEVLHDEDAVVDIQPLWHLEGPGRVLRGDRAIAPGVAARQRYAVRDKPLRELEPGARLACEICLRIVPASAPARVKEDSVAGLRVEVADVVERDDSACAETAPRDVDEVAART